ncbi:MAG TPA: SDR family NAD(P)-dependent oxidoreductase [Anaerolineae bacterium]|nr:SDR family NAD(P)-dependent oxidoreductase [Anaerolineae bacterium]HQH37200.1 SDR family NAD(P)-dependent oxidoreductase [Anaerolineae bacterium]
MQRRVVMITGASSGIGAATAKLFARQGWAVVLAARSQDKLHKLAEDITAVGGEALVVPTDVTAQSDIENLVQKTVATFGRIDVLVNNAGVGISGTLETVDMAQLEYVFALNTLAPIAVLQAVAPVMKAQGDGVIVNISSMAEATGIPYMSGYGASKAALGYLSDAAAVELSPYGIDVLKVLPGVTTTEFSHNTLRAGQAVTLEDLLAKLGLLTTVPPETVARSIWKAVKTRRPQTYVTAQDRFLGMAARFSPVMTMKVLKLALPRYAPPDGALPQASVRRDLATLGLIAAGIGVFIGGALGYGLYRRRSIH